MKIAAFTKTYGDRKVLDFPGTTLERGKIYGVIGPNGSGKSTFARVLAGAIPADQTGNKLEPGLTVGYMPQKNYAFRMSVRSNILLGGRDRVRAEQLMERLQIAHLAGERADRLSGGETARMALARLMMGQYDLVILDEPTAAMDIETTAAAESRILDYTRRSGCAMILVTHSLQQARRVADEALFFYKGRLLESGPKEQVLYQPAQPETRRFLEFYGQ